MHESVVVVKHLSQQNKMMPQLPLLLRLGRRKRGKIILKRMTLVILHSRASSPKTLRSRIIIEFGIVPSIGQRIILTIIVAIRTPLINFQWLL